MSSMLPSEALRLHEKASLGALAMVLTLGIGITLHSRGIRPHGPGKAVEFGVEHTIPLSLDLEMSTRDGKSIVNIEQEGTETVYISVPEVWERREVRNVPLASVISGKGTFGFRRWHLPPGASVSYFVPYDIEKMILHNPSSIPIKLALTRVDLNEDTSEHDVILIQDSPKKLW